MNTIEVKVPDIGDFKDVPVIEVFVRPGDTVDVEDPLVTLESDKATMDVPSPSPGVVEDVKVKIGDRVSEGSLIVVLGDGSGVKARPGAKAASAPAPAAPAQARGGNGGGEPLPAPRGEKGLSDQPGEGANPTAEVVESIEVKVPDIGDFNNVPVIEIFVKPGDVVKPEDPLVTLESDKATMDVPSPHAGVVEGVRVAVGDRVSEGSVILTLSAGTAARNAAATASASHAGSASAPYPVAPGAASATKPLQNEEDAARLASAAGGETPAGPRTSTAGGAAAPSTSTPVESARSEGTPATVGAHVPGQAAHVPVDLAAFKAAHASPSVRKFARDLGVDLSRVKGTGQKGRILQEDVQAFVKQAMSAPAAPATVAAGGVTGGGELNLLPWPKVDFAKFGAVESKPLSRIKKISGANLARNWVMIPHVTQFDEADITELESLRVALNRENEKSGIKVTMLAFLIKASVAALRKFPEFNASIDGENLVYKQYFNIGFAADTPNGLVVPVLKKADQKGVLEIAQEMAELSKKARDGKLGPAEMQGGCFSISSLGGIGGTAFTPIINAPELAILGVSRSVQKPVWDGKAFVPRLVLPLSLSYDHRVIDGAAAARFTSYFAQILADFRRVVL